MAKKTRVSKARQDPVKDPHRDTEPAASDELLSISAELRSTDEELELTKEELQSSSEKLVTLNDELRQRNAELNTLSDDLNNLLVGVHIPVLVLDAGLRIRRFTPAAGKLLNLIESDVGRPFGDMATTFDASGWDAWFAQVIDQAQPIEREVKDRNGYWYSFRMRPCRTSDDKIDGLILIWLDIDLIKRPLLEEAREFHDYASVLLESSGQAIVAVCSDRKIVLINSTVEQMFGYRREELVGQHVGILLPEEVRERLSEHLREFFTSPEDRPVGQMLTLEGRRKDGTLFPIEASLSMLKRSEQVLVVAFLVDITERRRLEGLSESYRAEINALHLIAAQEEERRRVARDLHDGLCQQMISMALDLEQIASEIIPAATRTRLRALQVRAIRASEEARHIAYELHPSTLDQLGLVRSLKVLYKEFSKMHDVPVRFEASELPDSVPQRTVTGLYRIAQESLQNIAKHANATRVAVELRVVGSNLRFTIEDDGAGFDPLATKGKGGLGMVSMGERARMMGGTLSIESRRGHGTRIVVLAPSH